MVRIIEGDVGGVIGPVRSHLHCECAGHMEGFLADHFEMKFKGALGGKGLEWDDGTGDRIAARDIDRPIVALIDKGQFVEPVVSGPVEIYKFKAHPQEALLVWRIFSAY